ncbi:hypothetical protein [Streptomyces sp. NPDC017964]|uniref:hypothetical protein n=1 Tax=Streptomyces sp. NPDC017964 TaxID=3365022 RepID=UPI0037BB1C5D
MIADLFDAFGDTRFIAAGLGIGLGLALAAHGHRHGANGQVFAGYVLALASVFLPGVWP